MVNLANNVSKEKLLRETHFQVIFQFPIMCHKESSTIVNKNNGKLRWHNGTATTSNIKKELFIEMDKERYIPSMVSSDVNRWETTGTAALQAHPSDMGGWVMC